MIGNPGGRRPRALLAAVGAALTMLAAAGDAGAAEPTRIGLKPVGVTGPYFDLTMAPGESRALTVQLTNAGGEVVRARTYPADAYSLVNGGFGAELDGEPTSGTTAWIDYPAATVDLVPGRPLDRTFKLTVPGGAQPGEYVTSVALQNADTGAGEAGEGGGGVALRQVNRQVIAIAVNVPGPRTPGLSVGAATHRTVAGASSIAFPVSNVGNVRLKPSGEFVLKDAGGKEVSRAPIAMDSVYAGTTTFVELPLARRLLGGDYTASVSLGDSRAGVSAASDPRPITVPQPEADVVPRPVGAAPQAVAVEQAAPSAGANPGALPSVRPEALGATAAIVLLGGVLALRRRRTRPTPAEPAAAPADDAPPATTRSGAVVAFRPRAPAPHDRRASG